MRRVSFGLETGSQRLLDAMQKGSSVEANSEFIRNAHEAGLSVRCTMFKGYPGETAEDLEATADFLERHATLARPRPLQRVHRLRGHADLSRRWRRDSEEYADVRLRTIERLYARARGVIDGSGDRAYRQAKARVLRSRLRDQPQEGPSYRPRVRRADVGTAAARRPRRRPRRSRGGCGELTPGERRDEAMAFVRRFHRENGLGERAMPGALRRGRSRALGKTGTYAHTPEELAFGARLAWRNHARCIGRLMWDVARGRRLPRRIVDPDEIAGAAWLCT